MLEEEIEKYGPWFHNVEVAPGVFTREICLTAGLQPVNHPFKRWGALESHTSPDLPVLDVGAADGYFSVEFAKRGAKVIATDFWKSMTDMLDFFGYKEIKEIEVFEYLTFDRSFLKPIKVQL